MFTSSVPTLEADLPALEKEAEIENGKRESEKVEVNIECQTVEVQVPGKGSGPDRSQPVVTRRELWSYYRACTNPLDLYLPIWFVT
jgi:hypothetical protein